MSKHRNFLHFCLRSVLRLFTFIFQGHMKVALLRALSFCQNWPARSRYISFQSNCKNLKENVHDNLSHSSGGVYIILQVCLFEGFVELVLPFRPSSHGGHVEYRGIENFCFAPTKLVLRHFNSRLGVRNLLSMANMAAARIRPMHGRSGRSVLSKGKRPRILHREFECFNLKRTENSLKCGAVQFYYNLLANYVCAGKRNYDGEA